MEIKMIVLFLAIIFALIGCQKTIYIFNQPSKPLGITQRPANFTHPAQFYLCGNKSSYLCQTNNQSLQKHPCLSHNIHPRTEKVKL